MIELQHVTKLYPASGRPALDDVSTEIDKGEFVFLIGSSGSGKSTFLRLLLKEDDPTSGTIKVNGQTLNTMSKWKVPKLRRTMGCVFQDFRLLRNRTVAENVAFALEVINKPQRTIKRVVPEVLETVGLEGKAYVLRDPALIQKLNETMRPGSELGEKQAELGKQQGELGARQGAHFGRNPG